MAKAENSTNTAKVKRTSPHLKAFQFKPGVSGNPGGRPKSTLKDFARSYFSAMSEDDKVKFLNSIDKHMAWRMAEGNPKQENEVAVDKEGIQALTEFFRTAAQPKNK